jgi:8-oxo-dGTP diphosphatase
MGGQPQVVVGAAIVRDGMVLAARRSRPADLAGQWEFPGGKVEAGESGPAALIRECREELGVELRVRDLLGTRSIREGLVLHVYVADLADGEPLAGDDHDEVRWLAPAELDGVAWVDVDRWFVDALRVRMVAR